MPLKFAWGGYFEAVDYENKLTLRELIELDDIFEVLDDLENFKSLEEISQYRKTLADEKINKLNSPLLDAIFVFINEEHEEYFIADIPEIIKFISTKTEYDLNMICNTRKKFEKKGIIYRNYDFLAKAAVRQNCPKILEVLIGKFEARIFSHGDSCCDTGFNLLKDATEKSFTECTDGLLKYCETYKEYDNYIVYSAATKIENIDIVKIFVESKVFDSSCFQALLENKNTAEYVLEHYSEKIPLNIYKAWSLVASWLDNTFLPLGMEKCMKVYGVDLNKYISESREHVPAEVVFTGALGYEFREIAEETD